MAKAKVSRKWIASSYNCMATGYCTLDNLLHFQSPAYYTAGTYGWNFDVYTFGRYCITTGYRGMISHVDYNYSLCKEYDNKACEILKDNSKPYEKQREEVNSLLSEFMEKVFNAKVSVF